MDPHFFDLINREIDGETSPAESDELRSIAAGSPDLKRQLETLRDLVLEIESIPTVEPPRTLRDEILGSIRARRDPGTRASEEPTFRLASFRRAPLVRYALAIAAGFVFGFILYPLVGGMNQGARLDSRDVAGVMAPLATTTSPDPASAVIMDNIPATVSIRSTSASAAVAIDLSATSASPLMVTWRPDQFALELLERQAGAATVAMSSGQFRISAAGPARFEVRLRRLQPGHSPVRIERNAAGNGIAIMETQ